MIDFITKRYHDNDKVTGKRVNDNCKLEFDFAARTKTDKLLAVVMDRKMRNISKWAWSVDLYLGGKIFIDMNGDFNGQAYFRQNVKLLQERLHFLEITPSSTINSNYANTKQPTGILVFVLLGSALAKLSYIKNLKYLQHKIFVTYHIYSSERIAWLFNFRFSKGALIQGRCSLNK